MILTRAISYLFISIYLWSIEVQCARILFISSTPSPSHQKPFQQVWKALALKGHEMHVITPNPIENNTLPNLVQYNISIVYDWAAGMYKLRTKSINQSLQKPNFLHTLVKEVTYVPRGWHALNEYTLSLEEVRKVINAKPKLKFDAVIVEWLYPALAAFGGYFQAPLIGICSLGAPTNGLDAIGNILNPIVTPDHNIPLKRDLSFRDRLLSVIYAVWIRVIYDWYIIPWEDVSAKKHFGENLPYLGDIQKNISLLLLNRNQISHRMMQLVPGIVEFGGLKYDKTIQSLDSDTKSFLDRSYNGVIYFSLGASIKQAIFLTPEQVGVFKRVLGSLPYNVLWKWENKTMEGKPKNVFISKWINQTAVLAPSHQKPFQAIWKALSLRGHNVHVLTPNPLKDINLTNLTEYDLSEYYEIIKNTKIENRKYFLHKPTFISAFIKDGFATKLLSGLYNRTLSHRETRRLIESNKSFDVVIVEWLFPTLAAFGAYYEAPIIGVTSLGAPIVALDTLGNPSHPLIAPDMNLPLGRDMTFKERLLSILYSIYVRIFYHLVVLPREDANIKRYLKKDLPYLGHIERNISVLLMNRNPAFHRIFPQFPNVIDLGGIKVESVEHTIDPAMVKFLDSSNESAIYFSLGSSMKSNLLDEEIISKLKNVFKSLPYKVIWKWEEETMKEKPGNVYISQWIPQTTLLEHPNVKLFITQGGLQSTEEAIAAHKPIIGIPFHSDQTTNVDTCVKYGMGKMLDLEDLTEDTLRNYILEIMNNPSYAENAKKLDELMKDQPQDGLEKAIWWIEYVIRHKGAKHLRSVAVDMPWWKYLMLDVFAFLLVVFWATIFSIYLVIKILVRLTRRIFGRKQKIAEKKKKN